MRAGRSHVQCSFVHFWKCVCLLASLLAYVRARMHMLVDLYVRGCMCECVHMFEMGLAQDLD